MDKFPNVDKSLGPEAACAFRYGALRMKSTGEVIYFIKDLKEEPAPSEDAGFCHCEARLCVALQRQV
jgi:hypothetical protein